MQLVVDLLDALLDRYPVLPQHIHDGVLRLQRLQTDADPQAGLAVQINEQHLLPGHGQRSAQVVGGCGLCHVVTVKSPGV